MESFILHANQQYVYMRLPLRHAKSRGLIGLITHRLFRRSSQWPESTERGKKRASRHGTPGLSLPPNPASVNTAKLNLRRSQTAIAVGRALLRA